jgi:hypothetical protein
MRRTVRTRPGAQAQEQPRTCKGRLVVLALAVILSFIAGLQAWQLWSNLPGVRLARLTRADYQRAQREAEASLSREARQGLIAANVSHLFTSVLQNPDVYPATLETLQRMLSELQDTQLGRLQLAAFLMLEMERAAVPVEQWWPRLEPALSGLDQAQFPHFLAPLEDNQTEMYRSLGLSAGAARAQAEEIMGQPHGPLLQHLAPRLARLAQSRAAYNDGSDLLCRRLLFKLLRQWTLDDGPPGVRLLAADLLAQAMTAGNLTGPDLATSAQLAAQLREWRAAYRTAAAAHPPEPYPIAVGQVPYMRPGLRQRFVIYLPSTMRSFGAALGAALVSAVALILARGAFLRVPKRHLNWQLIVGTTIAIAVVPAALPHALTADDLRRLAPGVAGVPRATLAAFCLSVVLLSLAALPRPRAGSPRRARAGLVAVVAVWTSMFLSLQFLLDRQSFEGSHELATFCPRGDRVALVVGPDSMHLLDGLQAWQP